MEIKSKRHQEKFAFVNEYLNDKPKEKKTDTIFNKKIFKFLSWAAKSYLKYRDLNE